MRGRRQAPARLVRTAQTAFRWAQGVPLSRSAADLFFKVHSVIRAEDGLHADAALDELCKLVFAKIWSERRKEHQKRFSSEAGAEAIRAVYEDAAARSFHENPDKAQLIGAFSEPMRLSDRALQRGVGFLEDFNISGSPVDVKGIAFQQVIAAATRAGMGQYFTPEPVVEAAVAIIGPMPGERVLDPFCGSGRFLTVAAQHVRAKDSVTTCEFHGIEKSERMVRIAYTDLLLHQQLPLTYHLGDSLRPELWSHKPLSLGSFDLVLTNPPFGCLLSGLQALREYFELIGSEDSVPLEFLGLEQSLRFLKPGGRMAIVLPESVLNTRQAKHVRDFVLRESDILAVLSLPAQTFMPFGGVGKASLLFLRKKSRATTHTHAVIAIAREVGYDNTNRPIPKNDLPALSDYIADAIAGRTRPAGPNIGVVDPNLLRENMSALAALVSLGARKTKSVELRELCIAVFTGVTPPRREYQPVGIRIVKVGDITGEGINWAPRERTFVSAAFAAKSARARVQVGDILLTGSAHQPRYVGQKVDIIDEVPAEYSKGVLCVAELLCLRCDPTAVDPVVLLFWLRSTAGYRALQACVVGQTAHISVEKVARIRIPLELTKPTHEMLDAVDVYRRALKLRGEFKREVARAQNAFSMAFRLLELSPDWR